MVGMCEAKGLEELSSANLVPTFMGAVTRTLWNTSQALEATVTDAVGATHL